MEPNFKNGILVWGFVVVVSAAIIAGILAAFNQPSHEELRAKALEDLKTDIKRIQKMQEDLNKLNEQLEQVK